MLRFSVFDEIDGGYGSGGGFNPKLPVDLMPLDLGPVDVEPQYPRLYPVDIPDDFPITHDPPVTAPPTSTPVQTEGTAHSPAGTVPVSAPVPGTPPTGSQTSTAGPVANVDPSLLVIGGAVLLAVLILK